LEERDKEMRRFVNYVGEKYDEDQEDEKGEEDHFQEAGVRSLEGDMWGAGILVLLVIDLDVFSRRGR
jgi:hypothetical protein